MRSRANLPVFLAFVVIGLLAAGLLATQMGGEFVFGGYRVAAVFRTATDLVPGDDVTMAGLRVGRVEALSPGSGSVQVSMLLHGNFAPLYRDARAVIRQKNLLGETYVEISRGTASSGTIADGGTIDEAHTLTPVEVDQVLTSLDPTVRDQLAIVINTLGQSTAGRGADMNASAGDLSSLAVDLQALAPTLASNSDHLAPLLARPGRLDPNPAQGDGDARRLACRLPGDDRRLGSRDGYARIAGAEPAGHHRRAGPRDGHPRPGTERRSGRGPPRRHRAGAGDGRQRQPLPERCRHRNGCGAAGHAGHQTALHRAGVGNERRRDGPGERA